MYFTYILKSVNSGRYYIGSCRDTKQRLEYHNNGRVKSTRPYKPWEIVHIEEFPDISSAYKREVEIKKLKSRKAIERIIKHW